MLLISRNQIELNNGPSTIIPIMAGVVLLVSGLNYVGRAMTQLRFFFGRSKPVSHLLVSPRIGNGCISVHFCALFHRNEGLRTGPS
jgi:hypothetical protein